MIRAGRQHDAGSGGTHVQVAPLAIDDLSTARYVHAQALKAAAADWAVAEDREAIDAYIYGSSYGQGLMRAVTDGRIVGGRITGQIVGTCGWSAASDETGTARIRWCHVLPMFGGLGAGSALLAAAEDDLASHGFSVISARTSPRTSGFFERAGYGITAHGVRPMLNGRAIPVAYLRKRLGPTLVQPLF